MKWITDEKNLIVILKPKFTNRFFAKFLLSRMKNPNYKIHLDDYGSFVWNECDGMNTVERIGRLLEKKFGDKVDPVYERLGLYIKTLEKNKFIAYADEQ